MAVRTAFWLAVGIGCLALASGLAAPIPGMFFAVLFFAIAWGIRRRQPWAASTGAVVLMLPMVVIATRWKDFSSAPVWALAIDIAITLACLHAMVRSAIALWRDRDASRLAWPWIAALVLIVGASLSVRPYAMPSGSMENTLLIGDHVLGESLTWNLGRTPKPGDVVILHYPPDRNQMSVKRVVGVQGDRLRIVNKQFFRNGSPIAEQYAIHTTEYIDDFRDNFPSTPDTSVRAQAEDMLQNHVQDGQVVVPAGHYFVLGDNRDRSLDSRYWGFISRRDIVGSPLLVYASYEGTPSILHTRWNRLLKVL